MSILLEDAMRERLEQVEKMPQNITLRQAEDIDTMNSILNAIPKYKASKTERFMSGLSTGIEGFADIVPAIEIYGRKADLAIGGYFGASPETIERKQLNLATAVRNFQKVQQDRFKYTRAEDTDSLAFGLGQGVVNYGTMLVGGFGVGTTARALGMGAAKTAAAETAAGLIANAAFENVEQQSERIPAGTNGNIDINQITPQWAAKSTVGTTAYLATSAILEKYVGFGKQVKMWETPISFKNAQIKALSPILKSGAKSFASEGATEGLQSLASSGILLAEGVIKPADMPERIQQAWKEAVIGGILGGTVGTAVAINQQRNVKTMLNEQIGSVISDPEERAQVVDAIYDSGTIEMTNVISKELELSSELNAKHGAIYDNMSAAITQAVQEAGAFSDVSENDLAQYVSETSKMFANQVLAEANKRGVLIDEVLKASDIKYSNGKIQLNAGNQTIAETPIYSTDVSAEIVTENPNVYYQSAAMRKSRFDNFADFYKDVLSKPKNAKNKEQFNAQTKGGLNIRIPHDTIVHDDNRHKLSVNEWMDLLKNIDNVANAAISKKKSRFDGTSVLLKIKTANNNFGVVLETFSKNNPLISTAFIDTEQNIDNWIKNEAVPSGTKTSFLGISLNNIMTYIHPNFKTKIINNLNQLTGMPKNQPIRRGTYNVSEKAIELFKDANYSTLPHEMAHFWLDNIWAYTKSGKASEAYMNNFKAIEDFLNIKPEQVYLTRGQQEKFARAYEKYLLNGYAPNGIIAGAFDDYDRWLKQVYNDAKELKVKLTPEAIEFFDSMTTGQLPEYTVEETQREIVQKEYPKAVKEAQKVVIEKQAEYNATSVNNTTVPVNTAGEKIQSRAYTKQAAILGLADELNYNRVNIEEQNKKAEEFVKADLERAQKIVTGKENPPDDILKNAIYNAYLREMLSIGNNDAYLEALQNQSLELTRAGQEIASQRGAIENIFDAAYWVRRIENNLRTQKAIQKFGRFSDSSSAVQKMDNFIKGKIDAVIPEFMAADNENRKSIAKKLAEDIAAEFATRPTELFQTMREPSELRTRTNAYNYLYKTVNDALGISLNSNQANEVIARADAMQKAIENTRDRNGNPSALFFKNMSAMEDYANSLAPTPSLTVLTSIIGRGNMLLSPKSIALNIESNYLNFLTEALTRRVANGSTAQLVDPAAIKEYLDYSRNVYNASGYQVSTMEELDATRQILSEGMVTSQGEGKIRALGRFFEQTIFKYGLGFPDLISKDFTFVDTVNLLATQKSGGSSEKATAIFKDACLIEPKTQLGRDIRQAAISEALVATYQNKGKLSDTALKIRGAINQASGQLRLGDLLSPFVKTPANVIGLGLDYTFGGLRAVKNITSIINDFKRGSLTENTRDSLRSLARNGLGFFAAIAIASMIDDDDYIPDYAVLNSKERELVKLKNGVFNSVKVGDRYVSLDYFGPLAMPLVAVLNARRGEDLQEQVFKYIQGAGVQSLKVPVIGDLKEVLEGTGRTLSQDVEANIKMLSDATVDFLSSRTVPAIVSDIAKITDDYERDTEKSAINRFKSRIPVWREELPAKYNYATGRPVETENALSVFFAGARIKQETLSPVIREVDRLSKKNTENKVTLSMVTKAGKLSELKPALKRKVEVEFAKNYARDVKTLIGTSYYKSLDDEAKVKAINNIRSNIRNELKEKYGL